ncbi:hypothetical protein N7671_15205 [Pseudomonas oleovorans]|uniref:Transposase TnpC homeodomain domain-containing protein n=1 Tax=Ectopseudomonas oleovorans TaxID=301 RepID=A0AB35L0D7_ECTOL|nr:hypothetical protein [Pseudomonas oleovorans]MDH0568533.1 hypothetical protein [Pseudomonas oleovorans]
MQEENALLHHKLFSPKSERSPEDADSPQLAMFNEAEELIEALSAAPAEAEAEAEEVVAPWQAQAVAGQPAAYGGHP